MAEDQSTGRDASGDLVLWLLATGNLIVGIGAFMVIGLLSPISSDLRLPPAGAGWLISAYALSYAVSSPVLTALSGRIGRGAVLAAALVFFALGHIIAALAAGPGLLYCGRVVSAVGAGLFTPGAAAVAVSRAPAAARGRALAFVFTGFTVAQVAGIPLGSWLGYALGWRVVFVGIGVLAALVGLVLPLLLPRGLAVPPTTLRAFVRVLRQPPLAVSATYLGLAMAAAWVPYTFLGPLIEAKSGGGGGLVSALLAIYGLGALVGNVAGGRITDRLGPDRTLLIVASINIVMLLLVPALPWSAAGGGALLFLWAANGWAVMVPQQARLVALAPADSQIMLALNASAVYVGGALGSAIGAVTVSRAGLWWTGPVGALVGALALAHLLLAIRLARR